MNVNSHSFEYCIKMSFTAQLSIEVISFPVLYIITLMRYWDFNKKKNAKRMALEKKILCNV